VPLVMLIFIQLLLVKSIRWPRLATTLLEIETASVHCPSEPMVELSDVKILYSKGIFTVCQQLLPVARGSAMESDHICMGLSQQRNTFEGPFPTLIATQELALIAQPLDENFPSFKIERLDVLVPLMVFPFEMSGFGVMPKEKEKNSVTESMTPKHSLDILVIEFSRRNRL
jgi:hypothetical protein